MTLIETSLGIFIVLLFLLSSFSLFNDFRLEVAVRRAATEGVRCLAGLEGGCYVPVAPERFVDWKRDDPKTGKFTGKLNEFSATTKWMDSFEQSFRVQSRYSSVIDAEFNQKNFEIFTLRPSMKSILVRTGTLPRLGNLGGLGRDIVVEPRRGEFGTREFHLNVSVPAGSFPSINLHSSDDGYFTLPANLLPDSELPKLGLAAVNKLPEGARHAAREALRKSTLQKIVNALPDSSAVIDASDNRNTNDLSTWSKRVDVQAGTPSVGEALGDSIPVMIYVEEATAFKGLAKVGLTLSGPGGTAECSNGDLGGADFGPNGAWNMVPRGISKEYASTIDPNHIKELSLYKNCHLKGDSRYQIHLTLDKDPTETGRIVWDAKVTVYFPQYKVSSFNPEIAEMTPQNSAGTEHKLCESSSNSGECGCEFDNGKTGYDLVKFNAKDDQCSKMSLGGGCFIDSTSSLLSVKNDFRYAFLNPPEISRIKVLPHDTPTCPSVVKSIPFSSPRICDTHEDDSGCITSNTPGCSFSDSDRASAGLDVSSVPNLTCLHTEVRDAINPTTELPCTVKWEPKDCSDSPLTKEQATEIALKTCPTADPKTISLIDNGINPKRLYPEYAVGIPIDPEVRYSNNKYSCDLFKIESNPVEKIVGSQPFLGQPLPASPDWTTEKIKDALYGKGVPAGAFLQVDSKYVGVYGPQDLSVPRRQMYSCTSTMNKPLLGEYKDEIPSDCRVETYEIIAGPGQPTYSCTTTSGKIRTGKIGVPADCRPGTLSVVPGPGYVTAGETEQKIIALGVPAGSSPPPGCEDGKCYVEAAAPSAPLPDANQGFDAKRTAELALATIKPSMPYAKLCTPEEALETPGCVVSEIRYKAGEKEAVYAVTLTYEKLFSWKPERVTVERREANAHAMF